MRSYHQRARKWDEGEFICPVEEGCRSYTGTSTQRFLKSLGTSGSNLTKALKPGRGGRRRELLALASKEG